MFINAQRIETMLAEQGLTKKKLAELCGTTSQNNSTVIKRGTCSPITAGKLAAGLGCGVDEIVREVRL